MQYTSILAILTAIAGTSIAAPQAEAKSMMAQTSLWTMQDFKRQCADGTCHYSFAVNTNDGTAATPCAYDITGNPASQAPYQGIKCGDFTIGSTWDGHTFPNDPFQVLSVVKGGLIIYPGYSDKDLASGNFVKPDRQFAPQQLP